MQEFDLIVIGGGSGLDIASAVAFHYGLKVAIIEKDGLGGTCLNRGCIPSKLLIHSANVAETIKRAVIRYKSQRIFCRFSENNDKSKWNY